MSLSRAVFAISTIVAGVVFMVGLAFVYADSCYDYTLYEPCPRRDCHVIGPHPSLPCPGGPWTASDAAAAGLDLSDPCGFKIIRLDVPKNYAYDGNLDEGYMSVGEFQFDCELLDSCDRIAFWMPPGHFTVTCRSNRDVCSTINRTTAGGAECPGGGVTGEDD